MNEGATVIAMSSMIQHLPGNLTKLNSCHNTHPFLVARTQLTAGFKDRSLQLSKFAVGRDSILKPTPTLQTLGEVSGCIGMRGNRLIHTQVDGSGHASQLVKFICGQVLITRFEHLATLLP
jgi:hypothetical protein